MSETTTPQGKRPGNCRRCGDGVDFYESNSACVKCQCESSMRSYRKRTSSEGAEHKTLDRDGLFELIQKALTKAGMNERDRKDVLEAIDTDSIDQDATWSLAAKVVQQKRPRKPPSNDPFSDGE